MAIKGLLLDIGGVLLTKGWGRHLRTQAAQRFGLDCDEMQDRHAVVFHIYEEGRISLSEYLKRIVFYEKRDFTEEQFVDFMFSHSEPYPDMIELIRGIKSQHSLQAVALSNEGRELTNYRIDKFNLRQLIDFFVCSCYVGVEKPDPAIFSLAMDQVQLRKDEVIFIDDTALHIEVARELGIPTIHHVDVASTRAELAAVGLIL